MWIRLNKDVGFGDIGTVVLYKENKFFPDLSTETREELITQMKENIDSYRGVKVLYHGSSKNIMERDFAEYDFSYILKKNKFNNKYIISDLDDNSKALIGYEFKDLSRMENILFPTNINTEENKETGVDYFGTILVSNQLLFFFNISEGITKIELYNDVKMSNNTENTEGFIDSEFMDAVSPEIKTESPACIIYLGPKPDLRNNPSSWYYENDPQIQKRLSKSESLVEYSKQEDEILKSKIVWLVLSDSSDNIDSINLSYDSWVNNDNANRNKPEYTLRNDEYFGSRKNIGLVKELGDCSYILDERNSVLLGNKESEKHPILDKKLKRMNNKWLLTLLMPGQEIKGEVNSLSEAQYPEKGDIYKIKDKEEFYEYIGSNTLRYCPNVVYSKNDVVEFNGERWISLSDSNMGEVPGIGTNWILETKIRDFYTTQVRVICQYINKFNENGEIAELVTDENCGYTVPRNYLTVQGRGDTVSFDVCSNPGYRPTIQNIVIEDGNKVSKRGIIIPETGLYVPSVIKENDELWWKRTNTVSSWFNVLSSSDYPTIAIIFEKIPCTASFNATINGSEAIEYKEWKDRIKEINPYRSNETKYLRLLNSGVKDDGTYDISDNMINNDVQFMFEKLNNYEIKDILVQFSRNNKKDLKEISEVKGFEFSDFIDYMEVGYTLNLIDAYKTIEVRDSQNYEVALINDSIKYGNPAAIKFYPEIKGAFNKLTIEDDEGNSLLLRESDWGKSTTWSLGADMPNSITLEKDKNDSDIYIINISKLIKNITVNFKDEI